MIQFFVYMLLQTKSIGRWVLMCLWDAALSDGNLTVLFLQFVGVLQEPVLFEQFVNAKIKIRLSKV